MDQQVAGLLRTEIGLRIVVEPRQRVFLFFRVRAGGALLGDEEGFSTSNKHVLIIPSRLPTGAVNETMYVVGGPVENPGVHLGYRRASCGS